jgi:hypothetical protein
MKAPTYLILVALGAGFASAATGQSTPPSPPAKGNDVAMGHKVPDTLMFTIDELNEIQTRVAAGARNAAGAKRDASDAIENATLYLSTIVYSGPNDWTVWVNGVPIGPRQDFQSFKVTAIGPSFVELLVPLSAQGMRPVRLEPNQTFVARSGTVVEGPWR